MHHPNLRPRPPVRERAASQGRSRARRPRPGPPGFTYYVELLGREAGRRRQQWQPSGPSRARGFTRLYIDHVLQANRGADLDFLVGASGHQPPRHNH